MLSFNLDSIGKFDAPRLNGYRRGAFTMSSRLGVCVRRSDCKGELNMDLSTLTKFYIVLHVDGIHGDVLSEIGTWDDEKQTGNPIDADFLRKMVAATSFEYNFIVIGGRGYIRGHAGQFKTLMRPSFDLLLMSNGADFLHKYGDYLAVALKFRGTARNINGIVDAIKIYNYLFSVDNFLETNDADSWYNRSISNNEQRLKTLWDSFRNKERRIREIHDKFNSNNEILKSLGITFYRTTDELPPFDEKNCK